MLRIAEDSAFHILFANNCNELLFNCNCIKCLLSSLISNKICSFKSCHMFTLALLSKQLNDVSRQLISSSINNIKNVQCKRIKTGGPENLIIRFCWKRTASCTTFTTHNMKRISKLATKHSKEIPPGFIVLHVTMCIATEQ